MDFKPPIDKDANVLERVYIVLLFLLLALIIATPYVITGSIRLWKDWALSEETIETILIVLFFAIGYLVTMGYRKEYNRHRREVEELMASKESAQTELDEAFRYIGSMNVQIAEIKTIFSGRKRYPQDQQDFKKILTFFAERALSIVGSDWVVFRIIKPDILRTLSEQIQVRGDAKYVNRNIGNKALIEGHKIKNCVVVRSDQENLNLKVVCVLSCKELKDNEEVLIKAIVNELEMLFIVFTSEYYKESYVKK
jgi:hypothetical protein